MYYNLRQKVVTNYVDLWLLQNAANLITECASYYKMRRHYKMPQNSVSLSMTPSKSSLLS